MKYIKSIVGKGQLLDIPVTANFAPPPVPESDRFLSHHEVSDDESHNVKRRSK